MLKSHGQSSHESMLIPNGYAMQIMRASQEKSVKKYEKKRKENLKIEITHKDLWNVL